MINIFELNNRRRQKKNRDKLIFESILKRSHTRIKLAANQLASSCVYEVPQYIPGLPFFDIKKCLHYLKSKLRKNGFKVHILNTTSLFISWKHIPLDEEEEIERKQKHTPPRQQYAPQPVPHPSQMNHPMNISHQQPSLSSSLQDYIPIVPSKDMFSQQPQSSLKAKEKKNEIVYRNINQQSILSDSILWEK